MRKEVENPEVNPEEMDNPEESDSKPQSNPREFKIRSDVLFLLLALAVLIVLGYIIHLINRKLLTAPQPAVDPYRQVNYTPYKVIVSGQSSQQNYYPVQSNLYPSAYNQSPIDTIAQIEASKISRGMYQNDFSIGTTVYDFPLNPPWISMLVDNEGPDNVTVWINTADRPLNVRGLPAGQQLKIDMGSAVIHHVYMVSDGSSIVHVYANES